MVSSITPRLAPKCPSLAATTVMIKSRSSWAKRGNSALDNFLSDSGDDISVKSLCKRYS